MRGTVCGRRHRSVSKKRLPVLEKPFTAATLVRRFDGIEPRDLFA
ncbi:MAG TPA: hypothetical protein VGQ89_13700 [Candidatus Limnocylindrales bacterium]|jgi:hypothetical protein|nr:hypothetical protein [Candidatus Limnocylindrales bacterium]